MGNVIEVDFAERLDRLPLGELVDRIQANHERLEDEIVGMRAARSRQLDFAFGRIRELKRQLRDAQPVTEEEVLAALERVHAGEPVSAAAVTAAMYAAPQHSTVIRVGLALSRLARAGTARRFEPDHGSHAAACRWEPVEGGGDA